MDEDAIKKAIEDTTVGIYVLKEHASSDEPEDIGIVVEGIKVLTDPDNVAFMSIFSYESITKTVDGVCNHFWLLFWVNLKKFAAFCICCVESSHT